MVVDVFCFFVLTGQFCFCGHAIPPSTLQDLTEASCSDMCYGDNGIKCGGKDHVNVYSTSPPIVGLEITPSVSQIETGSDVTFTPSYDSAGEDLTFQLDYGKDSGKTNKNQSAPDMWTTKYFVPGQYQVMLYGNDVQNSILVSTIVLFFLFFGVFFADQYNDMVKYINILNMDSFIKKTLQT